MREECRSSAYVKTLVVLRLLLVYYTEPEINFIGLLEIGLNVHNLGEGLLGIVVATISVVENTDAVPEHGILCVIRQCPGARCQNGVTNTYLGVSEVDQGLLIGIVGLLKILRHQVAVSCLALGMRRHMENARPTKVSPCLAIVLVELDDGAEKLESLVKGLATLEKHSDRVHGRGRVRIRLKSALVSVHGFVRDAQEL